MADSMRTMRTVEIAAVRHCSRCKVQPRLHGQRWCRTCLTAAQRDRRAVERDRRTVQLDHRAAPASDQTPAPTGVTQAETVLAGGPATAAVVAYRHAVAELDRATRQDWRRSKFPPSTVLAPLVRAVTQAGAECRRLGVSSAAPNRP